MNYEVLILRVRDDYEIWEDIDHMLNLIGKTKSTEKRDSQFIKTYIDLKGSTSIVKWTTITDDTLVVFYIGM